MTLEEASRILREMYYSVPNGSGRSTMVILFGVKYDDAISDLRVREIVERADVYKTAYVEINHGRRLAKFVQLREDSDS